MTSTNSVDVWCGVGEPHAISALAAKRAEISGQIIEIDRQRAVLADQPAYIDHTLAIFAYAGNAAK